MAPPPAEQPARAADTGELSTAGAVLRWRRESDAVITYRLMYEAPSACYSSGPSGHRVSPEGNDIFITAEVAFKDAVCAQMITVVTFEGSVDGVQGPFSIAAQLTDSKSGRVTLLPAPAD